MLVPGEKVNPASAAMADDLISFGDEQGPVSQPADLPEKNVVSALPSAADAPTRHNDIVPEPSPAKGPIDPDTPELLDWSHYRKQTGGTSDKDSVEPPAAAETSAASPSPPARETASAENEDDLGDLLKDFGKTPVQPEKPVLRDPFQADPDASLRIEGISPEENEFRVVCHICGSLMYARPSQIGSHIKCHDCYTPVLVQAPREAPEKPAWPGAASRPSVDRDDEDSGPEYSLKPLENLAPIDTTIDRSLEPIDYNDDDFFRQKRELEAALAMQETPVAGEDIAIEPPGDLPTVKPHVASSGPAKPDDEGEYQLTEDDEPAARKPSTPVTFDDLDDLLESPSPATDMPIQRGDAGKGESVDRNSGEMAEMPVRVEPVEGQDLPTEQSGPRSPAAIRTKPGSPAARISGKQGAPTGRVVAPQKSVTESAGGETRKTEREALLARWERQNQKSLPADDIGSPVAELGGWLLNSLKTATRADNLIRLAIAAILIGFGNIVLFGGLDRILAEEPSVMSRITGGFMIAFGAIPMLVAWLAVIAHSNSIIMNAVEGTNDAEEGLDLSPSEWFARFIFVAPSFFAGALPGFLFGQAIFIGGGSFLWVIISGILSGIMITPAFLASAMYNSNPWQLFNGGILGAFLRLPWRVIRFTVVGIVLAAAIAACLYGGQLGIVAAFLFPALAVLLAFIAWWVMGDLIGVTIRQAEKTAEEQTASRKPTGR